MEARSLDLTGVKRLIGNERPRRRSIFLVALMMLGMVFFSACLTPEGPQNPGKKNDDRNTWTEVKRHQAEPDQALASGIVLSVRVRYGESGATRCQVRIENERNQWYDDYDFTSDSFNRQITNPNDAPLYTPEAVGGEYLLTVDSDTGYRESVRLVWNGEEFSQNLLSFSLD